MAVGITKPPFGVHVVWRPGYAEGEEIASRLRRHFGTDHYRGIAGGAGVPVLFQCQIAANSDAQSPISWEHTDAAAVVVLVDRGLADDKAWVRYVREISDDAENRGSTARVIPVAVDKGTFDVCGGVQAVPWHKWNGDHDERVRRLIRRLTGDFIDMLDRHHDTDGSKDTIKKIQVFISYATQDGKSIADYIDERLHKSGMVLSIMATRDIREGKKFGDAIRESIRRSAVVVIHTDSYSSREWCKHEVIEAKRSGSPMLAVDCLREVEGRSFPYLGDIPTIRMDPSSYEKTIPRMAGLLLDEIFKSLIWELSTDGYNSDRNVTFMSRPPELVSLVLLPERGDGKARCIVYPDPPLGTEEERLLLRADRGLKLFSMKQWQGRHPP